MQFTSFVIFLKKAIKNPCTILMSIIIMLQYQHKNIDTNILNNITNISCKYHDIDHNEILLKNNMSEELLDILERIQNNILLTNPTDLQLESYIFATQVEKLILTLNKQNINFEVISIVTNKCPSTNWRLNGNNSSLSIFTSLSEELKSAVIHRRNYTRSQTKYHNHIRIIDYQDSTCAGHDIFLKNIEKHHLISIKNTQPFEHNLDYGIYWILKFHNSDNFYIISSPLSYQLDNNKYNGTQYHASQRIFYKLSKSNFYKTPLYKYLNLRLHTNTLESFLQ
jgi:hypothetical protein